MHRLKSNDVDSLCMNLAVADQLINLVTTTLAKSVWANAEWFGKKKKKKKDNGLMVSLGSG